MLVLAHRGYWQHKEEGNKPIAFKRACEHNLGIETDLRDCGSKIVIAHDMPTGSEMLFEDLLDIVAGRNLCLALNIKSCGLGLDILHSLQKYNHSNYFTFDHALPDLVQYINSNICSFVGISDLQPYGALWQQSSGVWLDAFRKNWYDSAYCDKIIEEGKKLCIVSAELHGRETTSQWQMLKQAKYLSHQNMTICTDKPLEAQDFFND